MRIMGDTVDGVVTGEPEYEVSKLSGNAAAKTKPAPRARVRAIKGTNTAPGRWCFRSQLVQKLR